MNNITDDSNYLIIIPARGGSKEIPRKNVKVLNGEPLIYYSIKTSLKSRYNPDVFVSSDDEEILMFSSRFGANIIKRKKELSDDKSTLDAVIYNEFKNIEKITRKEYQFIITVQPTSPLLKTQTLDRAIEILENNSEIETIISVSEERHLAWKFENNSFVPNYEKRVNRQYIKPIYRETGAFVICRRQILINLKSRIGSYVQPFEIGKEESIDIDTDKDFIVAGYYMKRKNILFVLIGSREYGLGHVYRALTIAKELNGSKLSFLLLQGNELGLKKIEENNYLGYLQSSENIINDIKKINPDIIINDMLDTSYDYMNKLKALGVKIINFEDLGEGSIFADIVINALYPELNISKNHFYGPEYFCLRDEFILLNDYKLRTKVSEVLICFGGVDPNNLTQKVFNNINDYCIENNININIILGLGYNHTVRITNSKNVKIYNNINNISEKMFMSDIIFTSAGRTVYEIASIGVPTVVISQNKRELTHFFSSARYGFINLGIGKGLSDSKIKAAFIDFCEDYSSRKKAHNLMKEINLRESKKRTIEIINTLIKR